MEDWERLEIYLDDHACVAPKPAQGTRETEHLHRELDETIENLENRREPTLEDKKYLWDMVFRHFEKLCEKPLDSVKNKRKRRRIKKSLVSYLAKAFPFGSLYSTEDCIRKRFDEKYQLWVEGDRNPEVLQDRRPLDSGNSCKHDFSKDFKKIRDKAIVLGGNESLAHQLLRDSGELSDEFCKRFQYFPGENKSALAKSVRSAITPEVNMCLPLLHGAWEAKMRGPHTQRDWSGVLPGDWFCADDVTWNHYFKVQTRDGRWIIIRGECLLMVDLRTGYPLEFLLIPGKYNGEHIRNLILKVHDLVGLPRRGFYFEKGVWASRMVVGNQRLGKTVRWRGTENGLHTAGLNMEVRHASTPRAKPIEGLLRILQDRMRGIPGFVGFNEQTDHYERMQDLIVRARRGDPLALEAFPTMQTWVETVGSVLKEFTKSIQNGKMVDGESPSDAWSRGIIKPQLFKLPDESRYILATHRTIATVHQNGIRIVIRGKPHYYYNEHTGRLIDSEVIASNAVCRRSSKAHVSSPDDLGVACLATECLYVEWSSVRIFLFAGLPSRRCTWSPQFLLPF